MNNKILLYWRIMNIVFLITTFFLPWVVVCSDVILDACFKISGWSKLYISIEVIMNNPELLSYVQGTLIKIGELCLMVYTLLNCILIMAYNHFLTKYLRRLLLVMGVLSILMTIQIFEPMFNAGLTWGYWMTCIGLLSGLFLETLELIPLKQNKST